MGVLEHIRLVSSRFFPIKITGDSFFLVKVSMQCCHQVILARRRTVFGCRQLGNNSSVCYGGTESLWNLIIWGPEWTAVLIVRTCYVVVFLMKECVSEKAGALVRSTCLVAPPFPLQLGSDRAESVPPN